MHHEVHKHNSDSSLRRVLLSLRAAVAAVVAAWGFAQHQSNVVVPPGNLTRGQADFQADQT